MTHREQIDRYQVALLILAEKVFCAGISCPVDGGKYDPDGACEEMIAKGKCPECLAEDALRQAGIMLANRGREVEDALLLPGLYPLPSLS